MTTLSFTKKAAETLIKAYSTPDVIAQRDTTLRLLDIRSGDRIIDIGCGPGFLCETMAERTGPAGRVFGVDISPDFIAFCRERAHHPQLSYDEQDALNLSVESEAFDLAVCTQVAEYIPDTDKLLSEMYRVLSPGGRALVMATDWDCVGFHSENPSRTERIMRAWEAHCAHPRLPRTLGAKLRVAGFHNIALDAHPLTSLHFGEDTYAFGIANMIDKYVRRNTPELADEANEWLDELVQLDQSGQFYFASARMIFTAEKPV